ncbi:MAG: glycosyltransferase family 4 protein [Acidimicrobiales bacterium]|nr:glycosyltransferase family 4 protein [Acidimicrobiales bacterium]
MESPLRVAYLVESCWHRVPGGTARSAVRAAAAVAADHDDITLVGVASRHRDRPSIDPGLVVRHLRWPRRPLYEAWHRFGKPVVESATGAVDVVHAAGGATPGAKAPLVVTVHDLAVEHYPQHFTKNGRLFLRAANAAARQRASVVICPSESTRDDCERYGFDPDRLVVVPWGVDLPPMADGEASAKAVRRRHALPDDYILFVGTVEPRKNLARLGQAIAAMADPLPLVVVGPSGWGEVEVPPEARPIRLGSVGDAELQALYGAATVVAYPSLLEGFGLPVLEAMAHGTPVVTSAGTATEELVAAGGGIAVDPTSVEAIAAGLEAAIADRSVLSVAARAQAAQYPWSRCADGIVAAYRRAVA